MHTTTKLLFGLFLLVGCLAARPGVWAQPERSQAPEAEAPPDSADANEASPQSENLDSYKLLRAPGHSWAFITRQVEDHLLITLGDLVYLSAYPSVLPAGKIYPIYQSLDRKVGQPASGNTGWMKQVGRLEILSSQEGLTIGRVIAVRDIIQAGDQVLLPTE
jgi:hypothetical protein